MEARARAVEPPKREFDEESEDKCHQRPMNDEMIGVSLAEGFVVDHDHIPSRSSVFIVPVSLRYSYNKILPLA